MTGLTQVTLLAAGTQRLGDILGGWGKLGVAAAVFALSITAAIVLAKRLRMPDHGSKIGLVTFAILAGLAIASTGWPPHLGIDLSGGVVLIYELDQTQKDPENPVDMDQMLAAIIRRVNPAGLKEVVVREYGTEQIEIIIPEVDETEVARIQNTISSIGSLEFRILANRFDHPELIRRASESRAQEVRDGDVVVARWVPIDKDAEDGILGNQNFAIRDSGRTRPGDEVIWEVLAAIDPYDITGRFLRRASSGHDEKTRPAVNFQFNSEGARWFGKLTGENLPDPAQNRTRHLAIILDGNIYSAPTIQSRITDRGEITGEFSQDEVDDLVSVLNAGSLPTALNKEPISRLVTGPRLGRDSVAKGQTAVLISVGAVLVFMAIYYRFAGLVACGALVGTIVLVMAAMITFNARFTLPGIAGLILTVGMAVDANVLIYERIREELNRGAALRMAIRNGFSRATTTIVDANVTTLITGIVLYAIGTEQVKSFAVTLILGIVMSMFTAIYCARLVFDIAERRRWIAKLSMTHWIGDLSFDYVRLAKPAIAASLVVIAVGMVGTWYRGQSLLDIDFTGGTSVTAVLEPTIDGADPPPVTTADVRARISNVPADVQNDVRELLRTTRREEMHNEIRSDLGLTTNTATTQQQVEEEFQRRLDVFSTLPDVVVSSLELELVGGESANDEAAVESEGDDAGGADEAPVAAPAEESILARERYFLINTSNPDVFAVEEILKRVLVFDDHRLATNHATVGPLAMIEAALPSESATEATTTTPAVDQQPGGGNPADGDGEDPLPSDGCQDPVEEETAAAGDQDVSPEETATSKESAAADPVEAANPTAGEQPLPDAALEGLFDGGAAAKMTFTQKISHAVLLDHFQRAFAALERDRVQVDVTNPNFDLGSDVPQLEWDVRIALPPEEAEPLFSQVTTQLAAEPHFPSSNKIGGSVAGDARQAAMFAILASLLAIIGYIWIRFQRVTYGLAAVVALVHDVLITLGALALSYWLAGALGFLLIEPFKISLPIVAAFLTIIGYSLNDTIVVFDRMREVKGKSPRMTAEIINRSVNQTMSRTVLTALTTLIVVVILYAIGGQAIHGFAYCMVVGVVVGTYSSVFIAAPVLLWLSQPRTAADQTPPSKTAARTPVASS